jgi:hypothetical protein
VPNRGFEFFANPGLRTWFSGPLAVMSRLKLAFDP